MSGIKKNQSSIHAFFKPTPMQSGEPTSSPNLPSRQASTSATMRPPSHFPHPKFETPKISVNSDENVKPSSTSQPEKTEYIQRAFTSSLSSPPSSSIFSEAPQSPPNTSTQPMPLSTESRSDREIKGSDDENSDSDSSLEDLAVILQSHRSENSIKSSTNSQTPSTPIQSKATRSTRFHTSPLPVLPKYKFDLKSLARHAQKDDATEASSRRVKAILGKEAKNSMRPSDISNISKVPNPPQTSYHKSLSDESYPVLTSTLNSPPQISSHQDLLESVIAETEGGELHKITRALKRTEATLPEYRWSFFETRKTVSKPQRTQFPAASISDAWRDDLENPQMRYQAFVSGFAEDMIRFGKTFPDEIFMWMIDELCWEPDHALRDSYSGVLRASPKLSSSEQVGRLVVPSVIEKMFQNLGGTPNAVTVSQIIQPVQKISDGCRNRDWTKLRSVIKFLGQASRSLQQQGRIHALSMLMRMGIDRVVADNVDLYDLTQDTIYRLCRYVPDDSWELFCQKICRTSFDSVEQPIFRLQLVQTLPSTSTRSHDLRRRLAMCFYFNDLSYAARHSHHTMDLNLFICRLDDEAFDAKPETDYREVAALVSLLDVAVDDARSVGLDLTDRKTESQFDDDIEAFSAALKNVIRSIGNPGAGFISKIEAKEVLLLVSQRVGDTLRSRPKARQTIWDVPRATTTEESLDGERDFMKGFLSRRKGPADASAASVSKVL